MSNLKHEKSVVHSALWAAAGDALGWITELGGEEAVRARTGDTFVSRPLAWKRRIGGRGGVHVLLPEGTYSDDTQLRLAVCRSIRGNGTFDPEAFARIELTAWQSYALGAGLGSKAAAANLAKRGVNWFSNFFESKSQVYCRAGGNGAAMRIQPHVWSRICPGMDTLIPVLRDAIITHGHPHGFCGAAFHALSLSETFTRGAIPNPEAWAEHLRNLQEIPAIIKQDRQLFAFWLPSWSEKCGTSIEDALTDFARDADRDIRVVQRLAGEGPSAYQRILEETGCFNERLRGSGWKTSLAASVLAWLYRDHPVEEALVAAANALGSDTDTIATMAGALLGAVAPVPPSWHIQDAEYIEAEARRLAAIAAGEAADGFSYPDPARWTPPGSQSDAILIYDGGLAVAGLGPAKREGEEHVAGGFIWQWLRLPFGQTIFAKRRKALERKVKPTQLPSARKQAAPEPATLAGDLELPLQHRSGRMETRSTYSIPSQPPPRSVTSSPRASTPIDHFPPHVRSDTQAPSHEPAGQGSIDSWTSIVIQANFDDLTLGRMLNKCIDDLGTIEGAAAFAGILAKAKLARRRRYG